MRDGNTYRAARRSRWSAFRVGTWAGFNRPKVGAEYQVGTVPTRYAPSAVARSKYMPHIGNKERGRHA